MFRCKSSARRRDRMKEHYQPSSSINLISSGRKEREKEQKKIFHWFMSVKDLRKRRNLRFFFLLLLCFQRISFFNFFFSSLTCQRAVYGTQTRRRNERRKRDLLLLHWLPMLKLGINKRNHRIWNIFSLTKTKSGTHI